MSEQALRLAYVPGVTPGKWLRVWSERHRSTVAAELVDEGRQVEVLHEDRADVALVRLPVDDAGLHLVRLYDEVAVAVLPRDHPYAEEESLTSAELADEAEVAGDGLTAEQLVEVVAGGAGFTVLPMSVARLHARRDVVAVPVSDRAPTTVALAWLREGADSRVEEFLGIVRGRTARSSRGLAPADESGKTPGKAGTTGRSGGVTNRKAAAAPRGSRRQTGSRSRRGR